MTSRTHDNFRHNFWTWVDPPVWTMLKKTALFWKEGIPKHQSRTYELWKSTAKTTLLFTETLRSNSVNPAPPCSERNCQGLSAKWNFPRKGLLCQLQWRVQSCSPSLWNQLFFVELVSWRSPTSAHKPTSPRIISLCLHSNIPCLCFWSKTKQNLNGPLNLSNGLQHTCIMEKKLNVFHFSD